MQRKAGIAGGVRGVMAELKKKEEGRTRMRRLAFFCCGNAIGPGCRRNSEQVRAEMSGKGVRDEYSTAENR